MWQENSFELSTGDVVLDERPCGCLLALCDLLDLSILIYV